MKFIVLLFFIVGFLHAHKVNLFVTEQNSTLNIYSYFADKKPCKNCTLTIKDQNKTLLTDLLNSDGEYTYTPKTKTLKVVVDAGSGHVVSQLIRVQNIKKQSLEDHIEKEDSSKAIKITIGLFSIFIIFFLLMRIKKR